MLRKWAVKQIFPYGYSGKRLKTSYLLTMALSHVLVARSKSGDGYIDNLIFEIAWQLNKKVLKMSPYAEKCGKM